MFSLFSFQVLSLLLLFVLVTTLLSLHLQALSLQSFITEALLFCPELLQLLLPSPQTFLLLGELLSLPL